MAYNGSGVFSRIYNFVTDAANAVKILASRMDAEFDGIATALSNVVCRDGQSTISQNTSWNSKKITSLGDATAAADALNRQTGDGRYLLQSADGGTGPVGVVIAVSASDVDCQLGTHFTKTAVGALTWTFTDPPATGLAFGFILTLTNGGLGTQTWPASVKWPNGTAPTLTTSGVDVLTFFTLNAGALWRGRLTDRNSS